MSFASLISKKENRVEVVVTFLALLELVKRHMVAATQKDLFGTIDLAPEGEISNLEDQDLEFVE
jgi:segregation and condensation protein A